MHQPGQVLLRQHGDRASHVHEDEPSFQHTAQSTSNRMREGGCQRRDRAHEDRGGRAGHGVLHWRNHCAAHRQCASPAIGQCASLVEFRRRVPECKHKHNKHQQTKTSLRHIHSSEEQEQQQRALAALGTGSRAAPPSG